jgi:pyrroline-5-carboxylate reductase
MKLDNKTIAFIGAGNMAEALIRGLIAARVFPPERILASDVQPDRLRFCAESLGVGAAGDNAQAAAGADIVLLAVKPQQMSTVLAGLAMQASPEKLFVSIAAGVPTTRIERELGGQPRVVRAMPNTPALVGAGAAAVCKGRYATDDDLAAAQTVLGAVGVTVRVEEELLDAVTALSGSGPAYICYVTEAMIQAGVAAGLTEALARTLAIQTVLGTARLMVETGDDPAALRRKVTSPGGTTEAALNVMAARNLTEIFREAIAAAARRGRELSGA